MPFYEYRCPSCSARFELLRSISRRDTPAECPKCNTLTHTRMLSIPVGFSLSGEGVMQMMGGSSSCGGCAASSCAGCGVKA